MPFKIEEKLVVTVASSALFDLFLPSKTISISRRGKMSFDFDAAAITAQKLVDIGWRYNSHKMVCGSQNSHKPLCVSSPEFCCPQNTQDTKGVTHGQTVS